MSVSPRAADSNNSATSFANTTSTQTAAGTGGTRARSASTAAEKGPHGIGKNAANGVTVSEKTIAAQVLDLPMEMLCATVTTAAAPSVVRRLLRESPRAVDNMLEGHRVLLTLPGADPTPAGDNADSTGGTDAGAGAPLRRNGENAELSTYVQHLQYGAIWPVGARDYLLVTSEEDFYSAGSAAFDSASTTNNNRVGNKQQEQKEKEKGSGSDAEIDRRGFIFASTSIDHLWLGSDTGSSGSIGGTTTGSSDDLGGLDENGDYSRSTLRLAGYVGEANATGGTDLTMYVDLGVAAYVPSWMLQMLANYGLSEMMRRIRHAADRAALMLAQELADNAAHAAADKFATKPSSPIAKGTTGTGIEAPPADGSSHSKPQRLKGSRDGYGSPDNKGNSKAMGLRTAGGSPIEGDFFDDDSDEDDGDDEDDDTGIFSDEGEGGAHRLHTELQSFVSQHKEGGGSRQSMQSLQSPGKRGSLGSWSAVDSVEGMYWCVYERLSVNMCVCMCVMC